MDQKGSFTGRTRKRKTSALVRVTDMLSRGIITVGGIGTIIAVSTVCVFLVFVVKPLFKGAEVEPAPAFQPPWAGDARSLQMGLDEYRIMGWALLSDGRVTSFLLTDGRPLAEVRIVPADGPAIVATSVGTRTDELVLALADGTVRLGRIRFATAYFDADDVPESIRDLEVEEAAPWENGVVQKTPVGQFRLQRLKVEFDQPQGVRSEGKVIGVGHMMSGDELVLALLNAESSVDMWEVEKKVSLMTGRESWAVGRHMQLPLPEGWDAPRWVLVSNLGRDLFVAWENGRIARFNVRDVQETRVAEKADIIPEEDRKLTALRFLIGDNTLIAGDSAGGIRGWFEANDETNPVDGRSLQLAHEFEPRGEAAVTTLASSPRSRTFLAGYEDGHASMFFMTSEKHLVDIDIGNGKPVTAMVIAPKDDGLAALAGDRLARFGFDQGYPEATLHSLFGKVYYEGYAEPTWMWQSSSGQEGYEMKLSLIPLIFGTLKATLYSMLMGAPIALLAAIFTSEFLHPKVRSKVKPTIELMATLPSVVLGFIAALVIAPLIKDFVPSVLVAFVTVPVTFVLGALVWQLLPRHFTLRARNWRLLFVLPLALIGGAVAGLIGPTVQRWFFAGDIRAWLYDADVGTAVGAWMFMLVPLSALIVLLLSVRLLNPWLRRVGGHWPRSGRALADMGKFLVGAAVALLLALGLAAALNSLGLDPRTGWEVGGIELSPLGTYVQRNALIVGFVMGFAVIPIIYTIAEDALSTVPEHLRSASLGAGATPWQTAVRIVIPTAMSGLFSALMIGLGRAVGETMIVLMAAGNTPIMELNIFNGFRTLSANIATELPEAVRNSTHYRTLFLAALVLFIMTFIINTFAEIVRLRFRKKTVEL